ncbi:6603_t:CDS:2 [Paraglomus brasilianum]|uniref:Alpha-tubulin N-acetyltransferase n=1 Tax=Paraglomus brasilianum TaxID=144538 RepID=A0A9N9AZE4_9GLOM|nr:6603_t:CDS:2 [Paraglomus brasilianum]
MGEASAAAQDLKTVITTTHKFKESKHHLYVIKDQQNVCVVGILKVGRKKLFLVEEEGIQYEIEPLCILDFYVHESFQRLGYGKKIFETMLGNENVEPHNLAYDRPSEKFLSFLKKYYNLANYTPQPNNFVVFREYEFQELDKSPSKATRRLSQPHDDCTPPRTRTMPHHGRCSSLPVSPQSTSVSYASVSATTLTAPPTESYIQAKRNIINLNQEYRRQMLYGSNPLV